MGQCGCCDFDPLYALPGPDGTFYAIQVDPGCPDCHEHRVGVVVHRLSGDAVADWEVQHARRLEFHETDGSDFRERVLLVLDPAHLAALLAPELLAAAEAGATEEEFLELVQETVRDNLRDAVLKSRQDAEQDDHLA